MKEMINITEILKDCPKDTELYSPIFGNVYLDKIRPHLAVVVRTSDGQKEEFLYDGRFGINGECMLFPSKENRDWSTFQRPFKDGDIVISNRGDIHLLRTANSSYCAYRERWKGLPKFDPTITTSVEVVRSATKEEVEKLFQAIKDNGYKWNPETKTLEKLIEPKFKVGDIVKHKSGRCNCCTIKAIENGYYIFEEIWSTMSFNEQDHYELVHNKFDITTLKPFDKVLVRDTKEQVWVADLFSHAINRPLGEYTFACIGHYPNYCIPYEGNEHLLGTTNDCDEYYKTW